MIIIITYKYIFSEKVQNPGHSRPNSRGSSRHPHSHANCSHWLSHQFTENSCYAKVDA